VVGHDQDDGVLADTGQGLGQDLVRLAVGPLDRASELAGQFGVVGWMFLVHEAPEHVLALVRAGDVIEQKPGLEPIELVLQHGPAFF